MRLLSTMGRGAARRSAEAPVEATPEMTEAAGAIGENYEKLHSGLDRLAVLAEQLRTLEPLLTEMRTPLAAEFEARRDDYIELIGLRTAAAEGTQRLREVDEERSVLKAALDQAETAREELSARLGEQTAHAQDGQLEVDRLRTALSQVETQAQSLAASDRDNIQRIAQQEEDLASLRKRLDETDGARAEAMGARSRAERDQALLRDENEALKKRSEEAVAELARLARIEASLEAGLSTERARAAGDQVEAARTIRSLETQAEAIRTEAAALQVRLETLTARADRLEALNSELGHTLSDAQSAGQTSERAVNHLEVELRRAVERIREMESAGDESRQRFAAMETARLAAVDRAEHLAKAAAASEKALVRSEERASRLQDILTALKAESEERVKVLTDHVSTMRYSLDGVRAESAMTAAALDAARRDRVVQSPVPMAHAVPAE